MLRSFSVFARVIHGTRNEKCCACRSEAFRTKIKTARLIDTNSKLYRTIVTYDLSFRNQRRYAVSIKPVYGYQTRAIRTPVFQSSIFRKSSFQNVTCSRFYTARLISRDAVVQIRITKRAIIIVKDTPHANPDLLSPVRPYQIVPIAVL